MLCLDIIPVECLAVPCVQTANPGISDHVTSSYIKFSAAEYRPRALPTLRICVSCSRSIFSQENITLIRKHKISLRNHRRVIFKSHLVQIPCSKQEHLQNVHRSGCSKPCH